MKILKKITSIFLTKIALKKLIAYTLLLLFLYVFKDFLGIFLLTFIFSYLFYSIGKFLVHQIELLQYKLTGKKRKIPFWIIIFAEYIVFIGAIVYIISNVVPSFQNEITSIEKEIDSISLINSVSEWHKNMWVGSKAIKIINAVNELKTQLLSKLILIDPQNNLWIIDKIEDFWNEIKWKEIIENILWKLWKIGTGILRFLLALILSFIFIIDRKQMWEYLYAVKKSNFGFLYKEYELLLDKVVKSFGLILKAQSMIALINALITMVGFYTIGKFFWWFDYIITLSLVVFFCSFIPILWMWLSAIPLMIVAYIHWWIEASFFVLWMVFSTTAFEAYFLNPKIVSSFFELPMSLTFVILLVSKHFFWLAGLLIGVSLFYFLLGLVKDFNKMLEEKKEKKAFKIKNG